MTTNNKDFARYKGLTVGLVQGPRAAENSPEMITGSACRGRGDDA